MNDRERRRRRQTDELIDRLAIEEFVAFHGTPEFAPVVIVIASYKERENIEHVTAALPSELCGLGVSAVVVIDGEDDGSSTIVRKAGHYAVIAPVNRGQGAALRLGYRVARDFGATFIVTADADGQGSPLDFATCLSPIVTGDADFVSGSRRLGTTHSRDAMRNLGVVVYAEVITLLTRTHVTDSANPIRAMRAELSAELELDEPQYQASELLISAIMHGARYTERPVTMRVRAAGSSKKGGNIAYGYRYGKVLFSTFLRERGKKVRLSPTAKENKG